MASPATTMKICRMPNHTYACNGGFGFDALGRHLLQQLPHFLQLRLSVLSANPLLIQLAEHLCTYVYIRMCVCITVCVCTIHAGMFYNMVLSVHTYACMYQCMYIYTHTYIMHTLCDVSIHTYACTYQGMRTYTPATCSPLGTRPPQFHCEHRCENSSACMYA